MATTPIPARPPGEPPSQIQTAPSAVHFDPKQAVPSQPLYFQRNDSIQFTALCNVAGATIRIQYRWLTPEGEIKEGEFNSAPFTNFTVFNFPLYEGWLLSFAARAPLNTGQSQFCYLQATLIRTGVQASSFPVDAMIWAGFLPQGESNGWPGMPSKDPADGAGVIRSVTGTTPAAGADIVEVVPTNRRWNLIAFKARLTTSATVANRNPGFALDDGVNNFYGVNSSVAQTATQTINYFFTPAQPFLNDTLAHIILPAPAMTPLKAGFRIITSTFGLQATDQWAAPQYIVQEFPLWDA